MMTTKMNSHKAINMIASENAKQSLARRIEPAHILFEPFMASDEMLQADILNIGHNIRNFRASFIRSDLKRVAVSQCVLQTKFGKFFDSDYKFDRWSLPGFIRTNWVENGFRWMDPVHHQICYQWVEVLLEELQNSYNLDVFYFPEEQPAGKFKYPTANIQTLCYSLERRQKYIDAANVVELVDIELSNRYAMFTNYQPEVLIPNFFDDDDVSVGAKKAKLKLQKDREYHDEWYEPIPYVQLLEEVKSRNPFLLRKIKRAQHLAACRMAMAGHQTHEISSAFDRVANTYGEYFDNLSNVGKIRLVERELAFSQFVARRLERRNMRETIRQIWKLRYWLTTHGYDVTWLQDSIRQYGFDETVKYICANERMSDWIEFLMNEGIREHEETIHWTDRQKDRHYSRIYFKHWMSCRNRQYYGMDNHECFTFYLDRLFDECEIVCEMDQADETGVGIVDVSKHGNTILSNESAVTSTVPIDEVVSDFWTKASSSDGYTTGVGLEDRWIQLDNFSWTKDHENGKALKIISLPTDFIKRNGNTPNAMMFLQHALWKGDIEIRIHIDSNPFQVGELICAWYYGAAYDKNMSYRKKRAAYVQMPHMLISASESNDVVMRIPFRSYKSSLSTIARTGDSEPLHLGSLYVVVMNQLDVVSRSYTGVDGQIFVRFPNSTYSGIIPRDLPVVAEMMAAAMTMRKYVQLASNTLDMVVPDENRDKPAEVRPASWIVPQPMQNWNSGTMDVDQVNMMRLTPTGQTPHPPGSTVQYDEMSLSFLARQWGLIETVEWNKDNLAGVNLKRYEATPMMSYSTYPFLNTEGMLLYYLPPVAHVANWNCYWRGSLEYRLDFISSPFQVGSILIAYIPRTLHVSSAWSIDTLKTMYHAVVDLSHQKRFVFKTPFISDKPWWPRREVFQETQTVENQPPGQIVIVVLNRLALMDNVPEKVNINIYVRAGDDFEVAVPCRPAFGPSTAKIPHPVSKYIVPKTGYAENIYLDSWHPIGEHVILRYGVTSDHVTQWVGPVDSFKIYVSVGKTKTIPYINDEMAVENCAYFVRVIVGGDKDLYLYFSCFYLLEHAQKYIAEWKAKKDPLSDSPYTWLLKLVKSTPFIVKPDLKLVPHDEVVAEMESDDGVMLDTSSASLLTTGHGRMTFGERFTDLKDYCRRYQLYSSVEVNVPVVNDGNLMGSLLEIPITPIGLDYQQSPASQTSALGGLIPYAMSPYRYYRGSLRFRLLVNCVKPVTVFVQHRPDALLENRTVKVNLTPDMTSNAVVSSGYSLAVIQTDVNPMTTFEVPFYHPANLAMLQSPNFDKTAEIAHYGMGDLQFSIVANEAAKARITLFYSLADDFRASCYVGFPPVARVSVSPGEVYLDRPFAAASGSHIVPEMGIFDSLIDRTVTGASDRVSNVVSSIANDTVTTLKEVLDDKLQNLDLGNKHILTSCAFQVFQFIANPTTTTFVIGLTAFLVHVGIIGLGCFESMSAVISGLIKSVFKESNETEDGYRIVAEMDCEDNSKAAFLSTLIGAICGAFSFKHRVQDTRYPKSFVGDLTKGLEGGVRLTNALFIFFRNVMGLLNKAVNWVFKKFGCANVIDRTVLEDGNELANWFDDCQEVLNPENEERLESDMTLICKAYSCAVVAVEIERRYIISESMDREVRKAKVETLKLCRQIKAKRDQLISQKLAPPMRFEPFVLCQVGDSQIGKTFLTDYILQDCLKAVNVKVDGEFKYTRTPQNQFWNGCKNQPACVYDDFLAIEAQPSCYADIGELMILKSKAVFNPPQAAIEEKYIRYNPLIVCLNMNKDFPQIAGLGHASAWMRRRDVMVRAEKLPKYKGIRTRDIDRQVLKRFGHLKFSVYKSTSENDGFDERYVDMDYDGYKAYLIEQFTIYYKAESEEYQRRLNMLSNFSPDVDCSVVEILQNYQQYAEKLNKENLSEQAVSDFKSVLDNMKRSQVYSVRGKSALNLMEKVAKSMRANTHFGKVGDENFVGAMELGSIVPEMPICSHSMCRSDWEYHEDLTKVWAESYFETSQPAGFESGSAFVWEDPVTCTVHCVREDHCEIGCLWDDPEIKSRFMTAWKLYNEALFKYKRPVPKYFQRENLYHKVRHLFVSGKSLMERIYSPAQRALKFLVNHSFKIVTSLLGVAGLLGIGKLYLNGKKTWEANKDLLKRDPEAMVQQLPEKQRAFMREYWKMQGLYGEPEMAYDQVVTRGKKYEHLKVRRFGKVEVAPEMAENQENVVLRKITKNTFFLYVEYGDNFELVKMLRCFALKGHHALIPDHYWNYIKHMKDKCKLTLVRTNERIPLNFEDLSISTSENSSMFVIHLPKYIPPFKDITPLITKKENTTTISRKSALVETLLTGKQFEDKEVRVYNENISVLQTLKIPQFPGVPEPTTEVEGRVFQYGTSGYGKCGSILISDFNTPSPIIGMHVAGVKNQSIGFSEAIVRESFEHLDGPSASDDAVVPECARTDQLRLDLYTQVEKECVVGQRWAHNSPTKSKIDKSVCHEAFFKSEFEPPVLSKEDERFEERGVLAFSPMASSCSYHGQVPTPFPTWAVKQASADVENMVLMNCKPIRAEVGVLTEEQAVCGIPGLPGYDAMELDTSEGFPFSSIRPPGHAGKHWLLDVQDGELKDIHPILKEALEHKRQERESGKVPPTVFIDCLKDQKLKKSKVMIPGKTRIFSISPVDYTLDFRRYFLDFLAAYQGSRMNLEHTLGINAESREWDLLSRLLLDHSECIVTGDYAKYGPTLMHSVVLEVFKIIRNWYKKYSTEWKQLDDLVREIMGMEMTSAYHLMINLLYLVVCGAPSGSPITAALNSLVNSIYIRIVFLLLVKGRKFQTPEGLRRLFISDFRKLVKLFTNGDDVIMAVVKWFVEHFNAVEIGKIFAQYGIEYTDSAKSGNVRPYDDLYSENVTYLKRHFVKHPHRNLTIARLDELSVCETSNWVNRSRDPVGMSIEVCKAMMMNGHGLGRTWYERTRLAVQTWWSDRYNEYVCIPTWDEEDERMYDS